VAPARASTHGYVAAVDRAKIDGTMVDGRQAELKRTDAGWAPDARGLPADGEKVSQLLDKSPPLPRHGRLTGTESAKHSVAPDKSQRQIQLMVQDQVVGDLYLGTSPGFKNTQAPTPTIL
jgi:hypothetical protein